MINLDMNFRNIALSTLLFTGFTIIAFGQQPVRAQKYCETVDLSYDDGPVFNIYAGETFDDTFGPATITGQTQRSRVNVRRTPGGYHDGTYGLVGDAVDVIGFGYGPNCGFWWKTRFSGSGYVGWIHEDYIRLHYGRGLWD